MKNIVSAMLFLAFFINIQGSDRKIVAIKNKNQSYSKYYKKEPQSIKIDHIISRGAMDISWFLFSKYNKRSFKNTVLPDGQNIFRPARNTEDLIEAPYMQTDKPYKHETEYIRNGAIQGALRARDRVLYDSGKLFFKGEHIKSVSLFAFAAVTELEILQKKKISNFFEIDPLYIKQENKDTSIIKKYSTVMRRANLLSQDIPVFKKQEYCAGNISKEFTSII